jgi:hypothetical protein
MPRLPRLDAALARLAFLERVSPDERIAMLRAYRALVAEALKKSGPGSSAARRRRRALLESELTWVDGETLLQRSAAASLAIEAAAATATVDEAAHAPRPGESLDAKPARKKAATKAPRDRAKGE